MDARTILQRAWNDSVWSKVIAAGITAALAGGLGALAGSWLETSRHQLLQLVAAPVTLPAWSLAALGLAIAALAGLLCRTWSRDHAQRNARGTDDIQPNAVPIVEARLFACPLESPPDYALTPAVTSRVP
jgi:hypothetical protein